MFNLDYNSLFEFSIDQIYATFSALQPDPNESWWEKIKKAAQGTMAATELLSNMIGAYDCGLNKGDLFRKWVGETLIPGSRYGTKGQNQLTKDSTLSDLKKVTGKELYIFTSAIYNDPRPVCFNPTDTPDVLLVDAVRASMSIPFFLQPEKVNDVGYVDGGIFKNFPINFNDTISDDNKELVVDDSTVGFSLNKMISKNERPQVGCNFMTQIYLEGKALVEDIYSAEVLKYHQEPSSRRRTVFIDTSFAGMMDFSMNDQMKRRLSKNGYDETIQFFKERKQATK